MSEIKSFEFTLEGVEKIKNYQYGTDWPIVYLIENKKELYVGVKGTPFFAHQF